MAETLLPGTALVAQRVVPGVELVDARTGRAVTLWDYRGRTAIALCFLHDDCERCRRFAGELASAGSELRFADAVALVVATTAGDWPIGVLLDPSGTARTRFLAETGATVVVLVDRYGAAWAAFPVLAHAFPAVGEITDALRHMALMCADCSTPEWSAD